MLILTKVIIDMETGAVLLRHGYEYGGPVELCCGATSQQKDAQAQEAANSAASAAFTKTLSEDFAKVFGQNQAILGSLTAALKPVIDAGPNQKGYSAAEETAMRTGASDAITHGTQNAQIAANAKMASAGGGSALLPSGATEQIGAMINTEGALENAREQTGITVQNYETGRQNFFNAGRELASDTAGLEGASAGFANSVSGSENAATGAASSAMEGATQIQQANSAWMGPVMGMIGSIGGAALGNPTGLLGMGKKK